MYRRLGATGPVKAGVVMVPNLRASQARVLMIATRVLVDIVIGR